MRSGVNHPILTLLCGRPALACLCPEMPAQVWNRRPATQDMCCCSEHPAPSRSHWGRRGAAGGRAGRDRPGAQAALRGSSLLPAPPVALHPAPASFPPLSTPTAPGSSPRGSPSATSPPAAPCPPTWPPLRVLGDSGLYALRLGASRLVSLWSLRSLLTPASLGLCLSRAQFCLRPRLPSPAFLPGPGRRGRRPAR